MPSRSEVAYFGAGPAPLPEPVLERGAAAFVNYANSGLGLAEISHRSSTATRILEETKNALISLLDIPENYEVLFLHGGGSGEFSAVVFNMVAVWVEKRRRRAKEELGDDDDAILRRVREELKSSLRLDYLVTGAWSLKASQEAAQLLDPLGQNFVNVALDARKANGGKFGTIPPEDTWSLTPPGANAGCGSAFVYFCSNETVDGTEWPGFPKSLESQAGENERLIVADMSSNFLSRQVPVSKYAAIFGGAQKNIGITDVTIAIIRKDLLTTVPPPSFLHQVGVWSPPTILNWSVISQNNSLYNTMPIFSIWIAGEVMRDLLATHGDSKVSGQEAVSNAKAEIIYRILDANPGVYQPVNDKSVRSRMNICFRVKDAATEKEFLEGAEARMLQGLKGHRSVGGIRASNYNAVSMANVQKLAEYLEDFARANNRIVNAPSVANADFIYSSGLALVFSGIFRHAVKSEDELAAIFAHEVAHVLANHERESKSMLAIVGIFSLPIGWLRQLMPESLSVEGPNRATLSLLTYMQRRREMEADYIGMMLMADAGFNPSATTGMWKKMKELKDLALSADTRIQQVPQWMSSHPHSRSRIKKIEKRIPQIHAVLSGKPSAADQPATQPQILAAKQRKWQGFSEKETIHEDSPKKRQNDY